MNSEPGWCLAGCSTVAVWSGPRHSTHGMHNRPSWLLGCGCRFNPKSPRSAAKSGSVHLKSYRLSNVLLTSLYLQTGQIWLILYWCLLILQMVFIPTADPDTALIADAFARLSQQTSDVVSKASEIHARVMSCIAKQ